MAEITKKPFTLQLLRNANFAIGKSEAISKLKATMESKKSVPGQPILAFYSEPASTVIHALLGFSGADQNDIFESMVVVDEKIAAMKDEILGTAGEGFKTLGEIQGKIDIINGVDTLQGSFAKAIKDAIEKLDVTLVGGDLKNFIYGIEEEDGKIKPSVGQFDSSDQTIKLERHEDSKILDFKVNIDDSTIKKNSDGQLTVASSALTQYSGKDAIVVSDVDLESNIKTISLKLNDANKILSQSEDGLLASFKLDLVTIPAKDGNPEHKEIQVLDSDNNIIASLDATEFIVDGMLKTVSIEENEEEEKDYLVFTFNTDAGDNVIKVDISKYIDVYTAGNGIIIEGNEVSVKIKEGDSYIEVTENGVASKGIDKAISDAIEALDIDDTEEEGRYVSSVSEIDGKITISRADISEAKLNTIEEGEVSTNDIAIADTLKLALAKLQKRIAELEAYNNSFDTIDCGEYDATTPSQDTNE